MIQVQKQTWERCFLAIKAVSCNCESPKQGKVFTLFEMTGVVHPVWLNGWYCSKLRGVVFCFFGCFFISYLTGPRPPFVHLRGDSLTHRILIMAQYLIRPEGHRSSTKCISRIGTWKFPILYWRRVPLCYWLQNSASTIHSSHFSFRKFSVFRSRSLLNPFSIIFPLLYPLKTSKNRRFSDVFRGYRSGTLIENGLSLGNFRVKIRCSQCMWRVKQT